MKIAVVHGVLRGGAARRLTGTVEALAMLDGITLREFAFAGSTTVYPPSFEQTGWLPAAPAKPRLVRPLWRYRDVAASRAAWAGLWQRVNSWRPDVVFANPAAIPGGAPPALRDSAVPVLYYCDEPRRVDYEKTAARAWNPTTRLPYALMRRVERRDDRDSVFAADRLATNSAFTAARIQRAYGRAADVITPGIAEVFGGGVDNVRLDRPRTQVLSVGTLIPSKGHDLVIEAVAAAQLDLPVVIVAPRVDPGEETRLNQLAARHGVTLTILIGITDDELAALYRTSLATVYLAIEEPLGLVSLEAQACGTPVIVANDGGLVETVSDGVSGYHVPRSAAAAAVALRRMTDRDTWQRLAWAAAERSIPRDRDSAVAVLAGLQTITTTNALAT